VLAAGIEQFQETLRNLVPIHTLPDAYQRGLLQHGRILDLKESDIAFHEGEQDDVSLYLLKGRMEVFSGSTPVHRLDAGSTAARHAIAQIQPRRLTGRVCDTSFLLQIDRPLLDKLLVLDSGQQTTTGTGSSRQAEPAEWLVRILRSELFARLSPLYVRQIFNCLESISCNAGEAVTIPKEWTGVWDTEGYTKIWVIYSEDGSGLE